MFWKKANGSAAPDSTRHASDGEDAAIDAVAHLLKAFGENAFDTDNVSAQETRAECDGWAKKITVGEGKSEDADKGASKAFKRDYAGVRRYFSAQRSHEREFVGRSLGNLREAVHAFARCLTTTVGEDRAADERVGAQLGKLGDFSPTTRRQFAPKQRASCSYAGGHAQTLRELKTDVQRAQP